MPQCSWVFPDGATAQLGINPSYASVNFTVKVDVYNLGDNINGFADPTDDNAAILIDSFFESQSDPGPGNEGTKAVMLPGIGIGAAQSGGSVRVAVDNAVWMETTVWGTAETAHWDAGADLAALAASRLAS